MGRSLNFALLAMVLQYSSSGTGAFAPQVSSSLAPPVHLTAEQDHQRILELLHIASLGRGPDGDPKSPHAANFDESKVAPYPNLPDPLILKNGSEVVMEKVWWEKRRPEIVEDFDREIYGRVSKGHTQSKLGGDQHRQ